MWCLGSVRFVSPLYCQSYQTLSQKGLERGERTGKVVVVVVNSPTQSMLLTSSCLHGISEI